jgi:flavorubredoxin
MAHAGGVGQVLNSYPEATLHGDVSDLHLVFPRFADRQFYADPGERFDLGGLEIEVVEGVFRDMIHSRWFFETTNRVLFPGDGFAYGHWHEDGACDKFVEDAPTVEISKQMERFGFLAFIWTQYVDIEPYIARLEELVDELDCSMIAPSHGLPIRDRQLTMPKIREGLQLMSTVAARAAADAAAVDTESAGCL